MHYHEVLLTDVCHADITRRDLDDFADAFEKVVTHAAAVPTG
jgi:hypothetical protein